MKKEEFDNFVKYIDEVMDVCSKIGLRMVLAHGDDLIESICEMLSSTRNEHVVYDAMIIRIASEVEIEDEKVIIPVREADINHEWHLLNVVTVGYAMCEYQISEAVAFEYTRRVAKIWMLHDQICGVRSRLDKLMEDAYGDQEWTENLLNGCSVGAWLAESEMLLSLYDDWRDAAMGFLHVLLGAPLLWGAYYVDLALDKLRDCDKKDASLAELNRAIGLDGEYDERIKYFLGCNPEMTGCFYK